MLNAGVGVFVATKNVFIIHTSKTTQLTVLSIINVLKLEVFAEIYEHQTDFHKKKNNRLKINSFCF